MSDPKTTQRPQSPSEARSELEAPAPKDAHPREEEQLRDELVVEEQERSPLSDFDTGF